MDYISFLLKNIGFFCCCLFIGKLDCNKFVLLKHHAHYIHFFFKDHNGIKFIHTNFFSVFYLKSIKFSVLNTVEINN